VPVAGAEGRASVELAHREEAPGAFVRYTVGPGSASPDCFVASGGRTNTNRTTVVLVEGGQLQARACVPGSLPSEPAALNITLEAVAPSIALLSSGSLNHAISLSTATSSLATEYMVLYSMAPTCAQVVNPTCASTGPTGSTYSPSAKPGLRNGRYPFFHDGTTYTCCVRAVVCGSYLVPSSTTEANLTYAAEAPVVSHVVAMGLHLLGYSVASFGALAQASFVAGIAAHVSVHPSHVEVSTVEAVSSRRAGSVRVNFQVGSTDSSTASAIQAVLSAVAGDSSSLVAQLQAAGLTAVTSLSVPADGHPTVQATASSAASSSATTLLGVVFGVLAALLCILLCVFCKLWGGASKVADWSLAFKTMELPELLTMVADPDPSLGLQACNQLRKLPPSSLGPMAVQLLSQARKAGDHQVRQQVIHLIAQLPDDTIKHSVLPLLAHTDWKMRWACVTVIGELGPERMASYTSVLKRAVRDIEPEVRSAGLATVAKLQQEDLIGLLPSLSHRLTDPNASVQSEAAQLFLSVQAEGALKPYQDLVLKLCDSGDPTTAKLARMAFAHISLPPAKALPEGRPGHSQASTTGAKATQGVDSTLTHPEQQDAAGAGLSVLIRGGSSIGPSPQPSPTRLPPIAYKKELPPVSDAMKKPLKSWISRNNPPLAAISKQER